MFLVNLYPIIGILFLKWEIGFVFITYLAETLILVIFSTIKMCMSKYIWDIKSAKLNPHLTGGSSKYNLFNFLLMIYVFTFVLFSLYLIPWEGGVPFSYPLNNIPIMTFVYFVIFSIFSHTVSFFVNYIFGNERETISMSGVFNRVMIGRIFPLFFNPFIIIFLLNLNLISLNNVKAPILVILILFVYFDIWAYTKEHNKVITT